MKKRLTKIDFLDLFPILVLLFIGAFLRFYNLNWDSYNFFHPDERNIANAVSGINFFSQLNPHFFAYGGFSIYLYRAVGEILVYLTHNNIWVYDWGHINIVGRMVAATFSTATILAIYFLTKNLFGKKVSLLAALFFVFTPISIQIAHFAITENIISFFAVVLTLLCIKIYTTQKSVYVTASAIIFGMAVATKTTAFSFVSIPAIALLIQMISERKKKVKIIHWFLYSIYFASLTIIVFFIFSPYTILSYNKFIESMRYESGVALGTLPVPYTLQFDKTIPYLFQIQNFFWGIGIITIFSLLGFFVFFIEMIKRKKPTYLIFLIFPTFYFLYVGSWYTKFIRFMLPTIPFLLILATFFLFYVRGKNKILGNILITVSIITSILWGTAFFSIYKHPQTRVTASNWIYKNIPVGSKILGEHWDDGLPLTIKDNVPSIYTIEQLKIYDEDNMEKINYYAKNLSSANYIIINSRRLYGTLLYLPKKYPITQKYYHDLFSGKLGYKKVAEFTSYPNLLGVFTINDDGSEETFQVYDHPKVMVFKNVGKLSQKQITNILK